MAESPNGSLSEELAADAELTRRRLGRTLWQLEQKLSPQRLAEKGLATVRERAIEARRDVERKAGDVKQGTATWTAENPVQALALGFVAGWALGRSR